MIDKQLLFQRMFLESDGDGLAPLLSDADEINLAQLVYGIATRVMDDDDEDDDMSVESFASKVEATRQNLRHVSGLFAQTNRARRRFVKNFPAFKIKRKRTFEKLREIADAVDKDRHNVNISRIVGCLASAAGGGALIGALAGPAAPFVAPLAIGGGVVACLGGGVAFGATSAELALLTSKMKEAGRVVNEDATAFESMEYWFKHTEDLMEAIEDVVGFSVMKKLTEEVKDFLRRVKEMREQHGKEYNDLFRNLLSGCVKGMCASGSIQANFGASLAPIVITYIFVVCLMSQRNRFVFQCLVITHRIALGMLTVLDVGVELGRLVAGLVMRGGGAAAELVPQAVARAWALGVFAGVGLVIDVANIVLASIDIHKGSLSEEAAKVRKAAGELERECLFLEEVYGEISATRY